MRGTGIGRRADKVNKGGCPIAHLGSPNSWKIWLAFFMDGPFLTNGSDRRGLELGLVESHRTCTAFVIFGFALRPLPKSVYNVGSRMVTLIKFLPTSVL